MKSIIKELIRAFVVGCILPCCLIGFVISVTHSDADGVETVPSMPSVWETTIPEVTSPAETMPPVKHMIYVVDDGNRLEMELEEYILGVVLGEMPATFEPEALKAQAVVARTYTLKIVGDGKRHRGAVCTDSGCCQAYRPPEAFLASGGTEAGLLKVRNAVEATCGQVLTYDGELITATYFSCSGGSTEDAVAVWGYDVPYLQSVASPGEEGASAYSRELTLTPKEFQKKMAVRLSDGPESWFGKITYTEGGGVQTIEIGGVSYRGTSIRSLLKLRSTKFSVRVEGGKIIFTTLGYGHRVGMSQYGADAMALSGSTYDQILSHYYTGTVLSQYPLNRS